MLKAIQQFKRKVFFFQVVKMIFIYDILAGKLLILTL